MLRISGTATNKMDNFQPVLGFDDDFVPPCPCSDFAVMFHRNPIRRQLEVFEQRAQREILRDFAHFSIQINIHF